MLFCYYSFITGIRDAKIAKFSYNTHFHKSFQILTCIMREVNTDTHPDSACPLFPVDCSSKAIITRVLPYDYDKLHCPTCKSAYEVLLFWATRENVFSEEANGNTAERETTRISWNPKFHCHPQNTPSPLPILSQIGLGLVHYF
jgi:hypothetical protein